MAENKTYTAKDFSRYHSGTMSAAEMHALEKAALSDPFLSDALEGYAYAKTPEKDISELSGKVTGRQKQGKLFSLSPRSNKNWLRIAAMLVIFAGAAYMFYRFNQHQSESNLADNKIKQAVADTTTPVVLTTPDTTTTQTATVSSFGEKKTSTQYLTATNGNTLQSSAYTIVSPQNAEPVKRPANSLRDDERYYRDSTSFNGTIAATDATITPLNSTTVFKPSDRDYLLKADSTAKESTAAGSYANVTTNKAVADQKGKFKIKTSEPAVSSGAPDGLTARDMAHNNITQNNIVLEKETAKRKDTYTESASGTRENKNALKKSVGEDLALLKPSGKMEPIDSVVFIDYADKSFQAIYDSTGKEYEGKVVLSFNVNKKGQPENIKVEHSLCKACDEEAITLLKNGPHWIYVPNKRKQVVVEF